MDTIKIPTIELFGHVIPHNTRKWELCTNRHTSTRGNSWGWIEGDELHVTWSDDNEAGKLTGQQAGDIVRAHNDWLEDQKPIVFKLIEAKQRRDFALAIMDKCKTELAKSLEIFERNDAEVKRLEQISLAQ